MMGGLRLSLPHPACQPRPPAMRRAALPDATRRRALLGASLGVGLSTALTGCATTSAETPAVDSSHPAQGQDSRALSPACQARRDSSTSRYTTGCAWSPTR